MAQVLVIDDNAQAVLNGLREHAEANPFNLAEMQRIMAGQAPRIGDRPGFLVELPIRVTVAYSIEQHPGKQLRHLSASVAGRLPSPELTQQLLTLLGFANPLTNCYVYMEQGGRAINVLEPADGELLAAGTFIA